MPVRRSILVPLCLATLYVVWGSTYAAQRVALETFSPLQMAGARFTVAGVLLYAFARARGAPRPTAREATAAALSGIPLLVLGIVAAAYALRRVPSGLGALVFGSMPLFVSVIDALFGGRLRRREVLGLGLGAAGVLLVSTRGTLAGDATGALLLVFAAASYALGCVLTRRLTVPRGVLGTASQMLVAAVLVLGASAVLAEPWGRPSARSGAALVYLVVLGTLAGYSALGYLLREVRPALATSYAFVNPIVALAIGTAFGGEVCTPVDVAGLSLVLSAVWLVASRPSRYEAKALQSDTA